jgi:diguanylate cyclase (GGDEF)-like protein
MRILIADDDPISRRMLAQTLRQWDYEVAEAADGIQAWSALQQEGAPRLAILDWMMPGLTGPAVCSQVRRRGRGGYTYLILLTARSHKEDLVEGLESGADDYLTKPFDAQELRVRLRTGRRILDLESDLVAAREALREQATRDPLTWVWNRYAILEILGRELDRASRERIPVSILMADLDHFKQVNDRYGHLAGDAVLRDSARRMQSAVRTYDSIGRIGGEEFLLVLPGIGLAAATQLGERLRSAVAELVMKTATDTIRVTVSMGAATVQPGGSVPPETLIEAADQALYRAKLSGRNRVVANATAVPERTPAPPPRTHPSSARSCSG